MMKRKIIPWLDPRKEPRFPQVEEASAEGLLAAGGSLAPEWLVAAYSQGIFPWYEEGTPILWWCPHPRMVLEPRKLKVSRSLLKVMRNKGFETRLDTAFRQVMLSCATVNGRAGKVGTWITSEMVEAYCRLHQLGFGHSVETWREGRLVGGLYGVLLGRAFFGESMFFTERDASKVALARLCFECVRRGIELIDCQMSTSHLQSLGAVEIPRQEFIARLEELVDTEPDFWKEQPQPAAELAAYFRKSSSLD